MKLNITVDLQDIFDESNESAYELGSDDEHCFGDQPPRGESYNLNEIIQNNVTNAIMEKVSKDCLDALMKKANSKIDKALDTAIEGAIIAIEDKAIQYAEKWLSGENITLTDKWGGEVKKTSIKEIVTSAYDDTLNKRVDEKGKFTNSSYGNPISLVEYVSTKHIKKEIEKRLPDMDYNLNKVMKEMIDKHTTEMLAGKLNSVLKSGSNE